MANDKLKRFLQTLGPGIMFAGTCIGGSHLVQSTRAGADYGFSLLLVILLSNFLKYPFFEFATRYTNATGESVYEGYGKIGKWALWINAVITFFSMFVITAAIFFVCTGLMMNLMGVESSNLIWAYLGLSVVVLSILAYGKFSVLDHLLKFIGVVLVISIVVAVCTVLIDGRPTPIVGFIPKEVFSDSGYLFIIALMGWMPMGVDMSAWHSIWTQERIKSTGYYPTLKESLLDFNIGYGITVVLAIGFLTLGAYVMYGTGVELSDSAVVFSDQLVQLFSNNLGAWSYWVIALAAFSTMFGTSLTLTDGYTRSINRIIRLLKNEKETESNSKTHYIFWVSIILLGSFLLVLFGTTIKTAAGKPIMNFKILIDWATTISFLIAPLSALLNFLIVTQKDFPETHKPGFGLKLLSVLGLVFLVGFSMFFLFLKY